jgi:hypothetical protein
LVLILPRDEGHDHALDGSNLRLSTLRLTVCCAATHLDRSCDHLCDNELHLLCAALQFAELLGDRHHGTNGRYLDDHFLDDRDLLEVGHDLLNHHDHTTDDHRDHRDQKKDDLDLLVDDLLNHHDHTTDGHRDLLTDDHDLDHHLDDHDLPEDDLLNHHDHTTDGHRDHRDLLTDDHYLGDRDLLTDDHDLPEDDLLNHHDHTTDDHRDLLTDDRDLGHHFARMQDDLLDDYPDGMGVRHDLLMDGRDCPKDDPGLRLVCLNDRQRHRGVRDAKVCQILLPVADDVDRDFQGLALDEVYLQTTPKRRTLTECN